MSSICFFKVGFSEIREVLFLASEIAARSSLNNPDRRIVYSIIVRLKSIEIIIRVRA